MKTHILLTILAAIVLTACASHEGRKVSSTQDTQEEQTDYAQQDARSGKDFNGQ